MLLAQLPELEELEFLQLAPEMLVIGSGFDLLLGVVDLVGGAEDGSGKIRGHEKAKPFIELKPSSEGFSSLAL
jgi:hypothetical protein